MAKSFTYLTETMVIIMCLLGFIDQAVGSRSCNLDPLNTEGRLRKDLLCNYDKDLIPTVNKEHPVVITFILVVKAFNFNDKRNILQLSSRLAIVWTDAFLKWNPNQYDNIVEFVDYSNAIWQPTLDVINSDVSSTENAFCKTTTSCLVKQNGTVQCFPICFHESACHPNYRRWPFDTQNCSMHIGTVGNDASEIKFELLQSYIPVAATRSQNLQWRMTQSTYRTMNSVMDDNNNVSFPSLWFSYQLERHSAAHAAGMLGPALVIVIINLVSLWLAPVCEERLSLICANIFFHIIYLQQLSWYVPSNGDTCPLFIIFFAASLWLTIVLLLNAVCLRYLSQSHITAPDWVKSCLVYVDSVRVGQFCLKQDYLVKDQSFANDILAEENVESQFSTTSSKPKRWEIVAKVIDCLLFVVLLVVYASMVIELIPEGYLTDSKDTDLVIIRY